MSEPRPAMNNNQKSEAQTQDANGGSLHAVVGLRLNDCGKHWGRGGACCKCRAIANDSPVAGALLAVFNATCHPNKI